MGNNTERKEQAVYYKHNGYNCCQSVLKVFEDRLDLSDEQLRALGSGFGAGMGCMKSTCGALIGANMVLGMTNTTGMPTVPMSRKLLTEFEAKSGASVCSDLKGVTTGQVLCECDDCIRHAVELLEEYQGSME